MLNINGITVRLGGRLILDRATAAIPPGARVGLIGRNGAGKSTLMKVIIGQLEADDGSIDMPKKTKLGYIAQDAPSGTATPFDTVLAADTERAALLHEAETVHRSRPPRRRLRAAAGDRRLHRRRPRRADPARPRLRRGDAGPAARQFLGRMEDARRARRLAVLRARRAAARRAVQPSRSRSDPVAREFPQELHRHVDRHQPRARPAQQCRRRHPPSVGRQDRALLGQLRRVREAARRAHRPDRRRPGLAECPARPAAGLCRPQLGPRLDRQAGAEPRQDARQDAADRRAGRRSQPGVRLPLADRASPAVDHARHGRGRLHRRHADPQPPQPADRPRRPGRAARPQRQRQDHAGPPARRPAARDGTAKSTPRAR